MTTQRDEAGCEKCKLAEPREKLIAEWKSKYINARKSGYAEGLEEKNEEIDSLFRLLDKISHGMGVWFPERFTPEQSAILERILRAVQDRGRAEAEREIERLRTAMQDSIARADDAGDSWCSAPLRDALAAADAAFQGVEK